MEKHEDGRGFAGGVHPDEEKPETTNMNIARTSEPRQCLNALIEDMKRRIVVYEGILNSVPWGVLSDIEEKSLIDLFMSWGSPYKRPEKGPGMADPRGTWNIPIPKDHGAV